MQITLALEQLVVEEILLSMDHQFDSEQFDRSVVNQREVHQDEMFVVQRSVDDILQQVDQSNEESVIELELHPNEEI